MRIDSNYWTSFILEVGLIAFSEAEGYVGMEKYE
jgi:hypothetical protein